MVKQVEGTHELLFISAEFHAKKKTVRRVPKGTSEYQASWIIDSDHEEVDTVELQWLKQLWNNENMFETGKFELIS